MSKNINIFAAITVSFGLAANPVFAETNSFDRGSTHRTLDGTMSPHGAGGYYDGIVAGQLHHSNDDVSAAGGNAEQPERFVPQFGQE